MNIGIIGAGHLGKALVAGLVQSGMKQEQIILNARSKETLDAQKRVYPGIRTTADKKELAEKADVIVLVVRAQNAGKVLAEIGQSLAETYGVAYLAGNYKKQDGYRRSIELSKEYGLYRQDYCGCEFSKAEAEARRAAKAAQKAVEAAK